MSDYNEREYYGWEELSSMTHEKLLEHLSRYPDALLRIPEDVLMDGIDYLLEAATPGNLQALPERVLENLRNNYPREYYSLCAATAYCVEMFDSEPFRKLPREEFKKLYLKQLFDDSLSYITLWKHRGLLTEKEQEVIFIGYFTIFPEKLNSFTWKLDAPSLEEGQCPRDSVKTVNRKLDICKAVAAVNPEALTHIRIGDDSIFNRRQLEDLTL